MAHTSATSSLLIPPPVSFDPLRRGSVARGRRSVSRLPLPRRAPVARYVSARAGGVDLCCVAGRRALVRGTGVGGRGVPGRRGREGRDSAAVREGGASRGVFV